MSGNSVDYHRLSGVYKRVNWWEGLKPAGCSSYNKQHLGIYIWKLQDKYVDQCYTTVLSTNLYPLKYSTTLTGMSPK